MSQQDLSYYFNFWDHFFNIWKHATRGTRVLDFKKRYQDRIVELSDSKEIESPIFQFPNADIYNCSCETTHTSEYIPEPYWGGWNDKSKHDLKMVVVNFNPASGGRKQHYSSVLTSSTIRYSEYVNNQVADYCNAEIKNKKEAINQYKTCNWHDSKRAGRLMKAINKEKEEYSDSLKHYLGIELVPWHTANIDPLAGYFNENMDAISKWSLQFAIQASKKINGPLKNKVLFRVSRDKFQRIFKSQSGGTGIFNELKNLFKEDEEGKEINYSITSLMGHQEVRIYLLSGIRNDLPPGAFLEAIVHDE